MPRPPVTKQTREGLNEQRWRTKDRAVTLVALKESNRHGLYMELGSPWPTFHNISLDVWIDSWDEFRYCLSRRTEKIVEVVGYA